MTDLCRNPACGCQSAADSPYCEMCEANLPICPECSMTLGEHSSTCTVANGYHDCGEGPWDTEEAAIEFAQAEVGISWGVAYGPCSTFYVVVKQDND